MSKRTAIIISIILFAWCALLAYWYTCRIKGLCTAKKIVVEEQVLLIPVEQKKAPEAPPPVIPSIYFLQNKDTVKNVDELIEGTKKIAEYLDKNGNKKVYLDAYASSDENYRITSIRIDTVKKYFTSHGITEDKIVVEPNKKTDTENMDDRRVEVVIK